MTNRTLRVSFDPRIPSLRFRSPSRHQHRESTNSRPPTAYLTFRPQRFSRSRRLAPLRASQACFILQPRSGFTFQGFSPLPGRTAFRRPFPSCRSAIFSSRSVARTVQIRRPRLQGVAPGSDPLSPAGRLNPTDARSPLKFSPPRAFLRSPWRRLRASSARDLQPRILRVTPEPDLQRINRRTTFCSIPRATSRSGFCDLPFTATEAAASSEVRFNQAAHYDRRACAWRLQGACHGSAAANCVFFRPPDDRALSRSWSPM